MNKRIASLVLMVFSALFLFSCFTECFGYRQVEFDPAYLNGRVSCVDFVGSTVTIKFTHPDGGSDELSFSITQHTRINKDDLMFSISDLKEGDEVVVQYYDDPMSFTALKAARINIKPSN
ncbi:MAG: hypothetical protein WC355_00075 [Candidatus Omnitrophota bacterium]|jgi:hypothetical protein